MSSSTHIHKHQYISMKSCSKINKALFCSLIFTKADHSNYLVLRECRGDLQDACIQEDMTWLVPTEAKI